MQLQNALHCRSITKRFGRLTAVDGLNLSVEAGQLFGLLGPNGAGKSTLLKIMTGLIRPTSGWVEIAGLPPSHPVARKSIGYLPELFRFPGWMTGRELLWFHGDLLGMSARRCSERSAEVLETSGLEAAADRKIAQYSKGMQQRIGLAQAILGRPTVLFLDEPTSALDPVGRVMVRRLLQKVKGEGTAVFLNSHMLTDVELICDRVAIMQQGKVVREGTIDDISGRVAVTVKLDALPAGLLEEVEGLFGRVVCPNGRPEFQVEVDRRDAVPELAKLLVSKGRKIYGLEPRHASLEDVFLELFDVGEGK